MTVTVIGRKRAFVSITASRIAIVGAPICHMSTITSWPGSAHIVIVETTTITRDPIENASAPSRCTLRRATRPARRRFAHARANAAIASVPRYVRDSFLPANGNAPSDVPGTGIGDVQSIVVGRRTRVARWGGLWSENGSNASAACCVETPDTDAELAHKQAVFGIHLNASGPPTPPDTARRRPVFEMVRRINGRRQICCERVRRVDMLVGRDK